MTDKTFVSIVIDNYNYAQFLGAAIDSALCQSYRDYEVIVVDDGSTDLSREVIASYGDRVLPIFKENGGQPSAFNAGFNASRGEIVIFLDSDDLLAPAAAESAVRSMGNPNVVKVHWPMWEIGEAGAKTGRLIPPSPLVQGELRDSVIRSGPTNTVNSPTSGNAWRRTFLDRVMPVPNYGYQHAGDAYLFTLAPLFGRIATIEEPQGCYRVHSRNFSTRETLADLGENLFRYRILCDALALHLRRMGIEPDQESWLGPDSPYVWMRDMLSLSEALAGAIPKNATYILVDDSQLGVKFVPELRAVPFMEKDGVYWGSPADGCSAVRELHRLHANGAEYLAIVGSCFWWLEAYPELDAALAGCPRLLDDHRARVFDIRDLRVLPLT